MNNDYAGKVTGVVLLEEISTIGVDGRTMRELQCYSYSLKGIRKLIREHSTGNSETGRTRYEQSQEAYAPGRRYAHAISRCFELWLPDNPTRDDLESVMEDYYWDILLV